MPDPADVDALHCCLLDCLDATHRHFLPGADAYPIPTRLGGILQAIRQAMPHCAPASAARSALMALSHVATAAKDAADRMMATVPDESAPPWCIQTTVPPSLTEEGHEQWRGAIAGVYDEVRRLRREHAALAIRDIPEGPAMSWPKHCDRRLQVEQWALGVTSNWERPVPPGVTAESFVLVGLYRDRPIPSAVPVKRDDPPRTLPPAVDAILNYLATIGIDSRDVCEAQRHTLSREVNALAKAAMGTPLREDAAEVFRSVTEWASRGFTLAYVADLLPAERDQMLHEWERDEGWLVMDLRNLAERLAAPRPPPVSHASDLRPASFYTSFNIEANTLLKAKRDGRLQGATMIGKRWHYPEPEVRKLYPEHFTRRVR
jgi:hypothetical protein